MPSFVLLGGSPSSTSRGSHVIAVLAKRLAARGFAADAIEIRDLDASALVHADCRHPDIRAAADRLAAADAVIIVTPVYKAAYSGLLKTFFDLLDRDALAGKAVLPIATGGTLAHLLAIDYALRPVLQALHATRVLNGCYLLNEDIAEIVTGVPAAPACQRLAEQVDALIASAAATMPRASLRPTAATLAAVC